MWPVLRPHALQTAAWTSEQRFVILSAGRGSGKTEIARRRSVYFTSVQKPWSDPLYFYALPTFAQAKRVAWEPIKRLMPKDWIKNISESELSITTVFGSRLYVVGLDKPQRIEGTQWDGGVIDEMADTPPNAFDLTIRPALSHRKGWCWMTGVPKRFGVGAVGFKKKFDIGQTGADPDMVSYTWKSSDILSPEEIKSVKRQLDEQDFEEQYEASWVTVRGLVYHSFDPIYNVSEDATYRANKMIVVGSDFNVDPMSWCLGHVDNGKVHIFDEIRKKNTNTQETLDELHTRYGNHEAGWAFVGDASGKARKTSAATSDYIQIHEDKRFKNKRMLYTTSNPAVADRNAAVNAMLCNAAKERRAMVHPRCTALIADLGGLSYKAGTREVAGTAELGHMSDAFGYIIHRLFPIKFEPPSITSSMVLSG